MGIGASWSAADAGVACPLSIAWVLTQRKLIFSLEMGTLPRMTQAHSKPMRNTKQTDNKGTYAKWKPSFVIPSVASTSPQSSAACPRSKGPAE